MLYYVHGGGYRSSIGRGVGYAACYNTLTHTCMSEKGDLKDVSTALFILFFLCLAFSHSALLFLLSQSVSLGLSPSLWCISVSVPEEIKQPSLAGQLQ